MSEIVDGYILVTRNTQTGMLNRVHTTEPAAFWNSLTKAQAAVLLKAAPKYVDGKDGAEP